MLLRAIATGRSIHPARYVLIGDTQRRVRSCARFGDRIGVVPSVPSTWKRGSRTSAGRSSAMYGIVYTIPSAPQLDEAPTFDCSPRRGACRRTVNRSQAPFSGRRRSLTAHYAAEFGPESVTWLCRRGRGEPVAAIWARHLQDENWGYGYVDDDTQELTIAVKRQWRGQGLGSRWQADRGGGYG